jgi:hypothetical protein
LPYPQGDFDSIQLWETDVQHNQVRLQFFGLLKGFGSIRRLSDDWHSWPRLKQQPGLASPIFEIIDNENAN